MESSLLLVHFDGSQFFDVTFFLMRVPFYVLELYVNYINLVRAHAPKPPPLSHVLMYPTSPCVVYLSAPVPSNRTPYS